MEFGFLHLAMHGCHKCHILLKAFRVLIKVLEEL